MIEAVVEKRSLRAELGLPSGSVKPLIAPRAQMTRMVIAPR